jgi:carboxymethylenebutenolidase
MAKYDFRPEISELFDRYTHGFIDRREFLEGVSKFAVGGMTAAAILQAFTKNMLAQQVPQDDKRIKSEKISVPSPQGNGKIGGYFARPADASGRLPGVVVIHGGQGLYPHFEDVARRLALANFQAFAPDALTTLGGHPGNTEKAQQMMDSLDPEKRIQDFIAAVRYMKNHPTGNGKAGVVGFCWGGGMTNTLAVRMPDLDAAVPYYGEQPSAADTAKIKAPLLIQYGALDQRLVKGWPPFEAALKANGKNYTAYLYEGAQHAFHNDTDGPRYNKAAAELSWKRTIDFFNKYLRQS